MRVIYGIGRIKIRKASCVTVGVFDGIHLGHQSIIKKLVSMAKKNHVLSVVLTFHPHPDSLIKSQKTPPLLISLKHRLNLISSFDVDLCIVVKFDSNFRKISADEFISDILLKKCKMQYLVVSKDFVFGKNKFGNTTLLNKLARKFNFRIKFQKYLRLEGKKISSTLIRSSIKHGDLISASRFLGRKVEVVGTVVGGDSRGRRLGFPTANIDPHHEVVPPRGVYLIEAWLSRRRLLGLANIGFRPTFRKEGKEIIEIHLLNFNSNIYDKELRIVFIKKLRNEKRFTMKSHLIAQINKDIEQARSFLYT